MHNPTFNKEYENLLNKNNIKALIEFLEERDDWQNPHTYRILEYFPPENHINYSPIVYEVINLRMELEDGIVISDGYLDSEDTMLFINMVENDITYGLNIFSVDSVIMIGMYDKFITISFDSGYIQILY